MSVIRAAFALEGHRDYQVIPELARRIVREHHPELTLAAAPRPSRKRGFGFISELPDIVRFCEDDDIALCVAAVDANRKPAECRAALGDMRERLSASRVRLVVGVALPAMEAWLLADEAAIQQALPGAPAIARQRDPHAIRSPKELLDALISEATGGAEFYTGAIARRIAFAADLGVMRRRCRDFDQFARDLMAALRDILGDLRGADTGA